MSSIIQDQAGEIRSGEQPDYEAIESYLRSHKEDLQGEMKIQQFGGGASNLTYLISFDNLECVMRRPPYGAQIKSAHDMGREYRVLDALSKHYSKAPKPLFYDESGSVLGCQFYIMERVHGVILRHNDASDGSIPPVRFPIRRLTPTLPRISLPMTNYLLLQPRICLGQLSHIDTWFSTYAKWQAPLPLQWQTGDQTN